VPTVEYSLVAISMEEYIDNLMGWHRDHQIPIYFEDYLPEDYEGDAILIKRDGHIFRSKIMRFIPDTHGEMPSV
jgi:hypothetical protein